MDSILIFIDVLGLLLLIAIGIDCLLGDNL